MRIILLIGLLLTAGSCAHQNGEADIQPLTKVEIDQIEIGQTTERDLYSRFGKPTFHGRRDGHDWWYYFVDGQGRSASLSLYFDPDGVVEDLNYSVDKESLRRAPSEGEVAVP